MLLSTTNKLLKSSNSRHDYPQKFFWEFLESNVTVYLIQFNLGQYVKVKEILWDWLISLNLIVWAEKQTELRKKNDLIVKNYSC